VRRHALLGGAIGVVCIVAACVGDDAIPPGGTTPQDDGGTTPDGGGADTGTNPPADGGIDTGVPPRCDPAKAFDPPTVVTGLDSASEDESSAFLTLDGLTLYFARSTGGPSGANNMFFAKRTDPAAAFDISAATLITELDAPGANNSGLSLSGDGLTAYFASNRPDAGSAPADIYGATRATTGSAFSAPQIIPFSHPREELCPFVVPDKSAIYVSVYDTTGHHQLFRAPLPGGPLAKLDAPNIVSASNVCASVTPDDLTMVFASDSSADPGAKGSWDVYLSRRGSRNDPWGAPTLQASLSSTGADIPSYVSPDGCEVWLHVRHAGQASYDVYVARRPK